MKDRTDYRESIGYIEGLLPGIQEELDAISNGAYLRGLPIARPLTSYFMNTLLEIHQPQKILEIGCLIGYSASLMALHLPENGQLFTIDRYRDMLFEARKNFEKLGLTDKITILEGDALEILPTLEMVFDFIFIDASKSHYDFFLDEAIRLSRKGTIILIDDLFQKGIISKEIDEIEKRNKTTYRNMRAFIKRFLADTSIKSSIIPLGDGLGMAVVL